MVRVYFGLVIVNTAKLVVLVWKKNDEVDLFRYLSQWTRNSDFCNDFERFINDDWFG